MSKISEYIYLGKLKHMAYKNVQYKRNNITVPVFADANDNVACLQMLLFFPNGLTSTHVDVTQEKCLDFSETKVCDNTACPMFAKNQEYIKAVAEYDKIARMKKDAWKRIFSRGK